MLMTSGTGDRVISCSSGENVSATVIPSLALPFSIIGTFAFHVPDGLQRWTFASSVVDDAIVMLEYIFSRQWEHGPEAG